MIKKNENHPNRIKPISLARAKEILTKEKIEAIKKVIEEKKAEKK
jgi:hypothetical protein